MLRGMLLRISEAWGERRNLVRSSAIGAVMPRAGPATVSAYPRREIAREQESLDLSEVGTTPPPPPAGSRQSLHTEVFHLSSTDTHHEGQECIPGQSLQFQTQGRMDQ